MKRTATLGVIVVVLVGLGCWFYYTPYLAVEKMREAAKSGDSATFSRYVNYPAVRESIKASVNAFMLSEIAKMKDKNAFAALGTGLAMLLSGPIVDAMLTPEAVAMLMKGKNPDIQARMLEATAKPTASEPDVDMTMGYEGIDQFVVYSKVKGAPGEPIGLVFQREGVLSWKLSSVRIPFESMR